MDGTNLNDQKVDVRFAINNQGGLRDEFNLGTQIFAANGPPPLNAEVKVCASGEGDGNNGNPDRVRHVKAGIGLCDGVCMFPTQLRVQKMVSRWRECKRSS